MQLNLNLSAVRCRTLGLTLAILLSCQACSAQPYTDPLAKPAKSRTELKPAKVKRINPGTVIGSTSPAGWTYNLIMTQAVIGAGDLDAATDMVKDLVSLFSSVMVANVAPNETQTKYIISEIGYGLYTKVGEKNLIISSETYKEQGASLSMIQSLGLSKAEKRIDQLLVTARTESMAVVDTKSMVVFNGKHLEVMVRNVVLLNQQSGNIVTLVWFFIPDANRKPGKVLSEIDLLEANSLKNVTVHIDRSEFSLGLVTEKALALNKMTWGPKQLAFPKELEPLGCAPVFTEENLLKLEAGLRQIAAP